MPDITMCLGTNCPVKETCYRFKAEPSFYQSYFTKPPFTKDKCEHYWKIETKNENQNGPSTDM